MSTTKHAPAAAIRLTNKEKAMAILNCLQTRDQVGPTYISDERYIQHNLVIADDKPGFLALQQWLPVGHKVDIMRAFSDGEYVFLHVGYNLGGPMVGMDIFRFKNGKAAEHWDNLQLIPASVIKGNNSMSDGPLTAVDLDKTLENKDLVRNYVQEILVERQLNKLADYFHGERYIEHHPGHVDGLSSLRHVLETSLETPTHTKIHLVLGEGDFCMVQAEGTQAGAPVGIYDLFRIENGKIAEHWDTIEEIPARESWQNNNGKF